jgi:signal transduction histidine kinase
MTQPSEPETATRIAERVAARDRQRAEFVGTVSHDLKTPLNAIVGFTSVLLADATGFAPEQKHQLQLVYDSARSLLERINALLEFYRLEGGRITAAPEWFMPAELLAALVETHREAAARAGVELASPPPGRGPQRLRADARLIRRALDELVDNAIRFGGAGPCRLDLTAQPAAAGGLQVRFAVRNAATGVAADRRQALAVSLAPQPDPLARSYAGLGLGLALAREAARALGGFIALDEVEGRARFSLVLELADQDVGDGG